VQTNTSKKKLFKTLKGGCVKNLILLETLKNFNRNNQLKRKLKLSLGLGFGGILLLGCLIIGAGIVTVQKIADFGARSNVQEQVENLKTEVTKLPAIAKVGCWQKMQDLMSVQIWLERPVADNINSLKMACLEKNPAN
jgi:hypothetical protein